MDNSLMQAEVPLTPKEEFKAAKEKYKVMITEYRFHLNEARRLSKEKKEFRATMKELAVKNRDSKKPRKAREGCCNTASPTMPVIKKAV